jgi:alpha-amylase/alpha-mannosidase (GH57 family)
VTRHVCVHGHFYQPPRENPWLESIQLQEGAYPYHDWNERISAECYEQNAASRVLDDEGRIVHIVNNYARISFNVGPTLLAWMADRAPEVHDAIVEADRRSIERFGHGSAMAQAYGHLIMPLATPRDRRTQVAWGVADFEHRFGRRPEGMWLPETAVDVDSLEALAEHDLRFTILEPGQAARVRPLGGGPWRDTGRHGIDTTMPYLVRLPSGREIAVFLYDGTISRAVAFEGLLADGAAFARRLATAPIPSRSGPTLTNIATDGESYGHHHRHGDMALAFALHELAADPAVELTNYAAFLASNPPTHEIEIVEDTSWSCAHGIERWRSDCGCADGGHPRWDQAWRAPLRAALDLLRDELAPLYEAAAGEVLRDPWAAREAYITVILDRSAATREGFLSEHAIGADVDPTRVWRLLELQRHAMLMFTSCGWFFDDLARVETVQVLRYAARVLELARDVLDVDLERPFLARLAGARSNEPEEGDGLQVYERHVRPSSVDLEDVAAHYAVSSLFETYSQDARVHCYEVTDVRRHEQEAGDARLALGRVLVRSTVTQESDGREYAVLHLGDHNIEGGVRPVRTDRELDEDRAALEEAFGLADIPETLRRLNGSFGPTTYTLRSLFRDEQHRILRRILDASIASARSAFDGVYRERAPLMRYLTEMGATVPRPFLLAADIAVNDALRGAFVGETVDTDRVDALLEDATTWGIELDTEGLALVLSRTVERLTDLAAQELREPSLFEHFGRAQIAFFRQATALVALADRLPFEVDLWRAQNLVHDTLRDVHPELRTRAAAGDPVARAWSAHIEELAEALSVVVGP